MGRTFGWLMVAVLAGALAGCKPSDAIKQGKVIDNGTKAEERAMTPSAPLDPATLGAVSGTIHFAGKAPARVKIDMSQDPVCSMMGGDNFSEQYVVKDGELANVFVYVKSGPAAAMSASATSTAPVVLDQVGCKYVPHVVGVMRGGAVEFRNSDGTMHNIHTMPTVPGNAAVNVSQGARGAPETKQFNEPELMMPVRCNNHPWMNAFINVASTPFFAVTDAEGRFEIKGLPAGTYTLGAVHEKLGEQTMTVTVAAQETGKADFTYSMK
ncbi:MAG: carboxypeptidase regulatory-like domain-containing protein [Edaphobacter sp.]